MQATVNKLQKVLDDYGDETESKKNHYNYLKTRDEANTASIEENNKRIREYSVRIDFWLSWQVFPRPLTTGPQYNPIILFKI